MAFEDTIQTRQLSCVKFALDISGATKTPQARASHITDGNDAASTQSAVNAVLVVLENLGFLATS